ncbi:PREDICTED: putative ankyrin repeat domain-containing protein 31 [Charadrius vociferus]|uniref:putative ankyrin repeat domain-containing protein 31 n=1 Tax=Charadrius vociferus TaxID=50402 RepID=UPI000521A070|nr:PREDICTED: putative ankyrin repeat domain-containing protein 31 [Charadrius vociferus]
MAINGHHRLPSSDLKKGWDRHCDNRKVLNQMRLELTVALPSYYPVCAYWISQNLSDEDLSPEVSLCLDTLLEDVITIPKEETSQVVSLHVSEDCQRTCMTIIYTDNRVKEYSPTNDTDLSLTSPGKIFMEAFTEQSIETDEFEIGDLLRSSSDSENLKMINPLPDKLECQGHAFSLDPSADESSDALPVQLVTALNALPASVVQPITPVAPNERQFNTEGEQLNSESSIPQLNGDCIQIANVIEPQLTTVQVEEIKALTGSNLQRTTNEQLVGDQQREKEIISDYWGATSSEKQTGEGSLHSVEAAACAETAPTTSRTVMQLRETSSRKCRDHVSRQRQILEETQQRMSHSGITTRSKAKAFSKIQKSTSKDKQDLETNICQKVTLNKDRKAEQRRRSKRLENKRRQEAFGRNSVNPVRPVSFSTINRRNTYELRSLFNSGFFLSFIFISGGGNSKNMLNTKSIEDTNPRQISLQTDESEPVCANLMNSDITDILQQTILNEVQNICTNISEDGTSCTEQTCQANAGTLLAHELLTATNEETVSGSPYNSTSGILITIEQKGPQPEKGGRILLNAEESVEGCHIETENASSLEIEPIALQLHEKGTLQIGGKREDLQDTNSKTDLNFDEGVFAGQSGTEGTEKNGEEGNAKTNVLSQFTETEEVQTKRVRLDPQETSQKAASYSSSSKNKLSPNQSQFSQASEQQTSKKSGEKKTKTKRNEKGETQLHIAARRGDLSLVKTLISSGICVNEQDYAGWTAIHEASNRGFTEVILELLKADANVNSRNVDGILPIHDAVSGNYLEAARILLQHGANPCERSGSGKSALDVAYDDEMKELLKPYSTMDSESVAAIEDAEEKLKELLLLELRTSKDADVYIQRLSQMQNTLNETLAKQKTERDTLAKKYRASVDSFKKGALRKQLVNLASRQKRLLTVVQSQEELVQKIQNYRKTKQVFSASCSEKQISNLVISCGNDKRQSLTADEIVCPDVVAFSMGLGASTPNGNRVGAHPSLENRFSAQECSQHPHICLDETVANKEAIRSKEASEHALASESRVREYPFDNMSKLKNAVEVVTLPSEPTVSTAKTKCSQQKDIDCVAIAEQGIKYLNPTSVTNTLNIVEPQSTVVNNNVYQPGSDCQQVLTDEDLHRYVNKKTAFQQQQEVILSTSTKNFPNTLQQMMFWSSENSFNANSVLTSLTSDTDYPAKLREKSSQSYSNQECGQKQVRYGRKNKKKLQLIDLLESGRIKPGENVLEFKLQEFSHKATLLNNGKIRTSKRQILENPVQWVKDLLGSDISVTWKYVWNKVTYLGTQLSKFLVEEVSVSSDLELPSQEREPLEVVKTLRCTGKEAAVTKEFKSSSVQFNSVESLTRFLQFREVVMIRKEEFLPCPVMEKHWSFYKGCEDFGF